MKELVLFLKSKLLWAGFAIVLTVVTILSFANLGSTVSPKPNDMPVAIVVADKGVQTPAGEMRFGAMMQEKLTAATLPNGEDSPFAWTVVESEEAALDGLNREQFYAALVVPEDLSAKLASLQGKTPQAAEVKLYVNQGKNFNGATMVQTALDKMMLAVNVQVREQMLGQIKQRGDVLNTVQASLLAAPITAKFETVNPVGTHSAGGNAPVLLTQLMWLGGLVGTVVLMFAAKQAVPQGRKLSVLCGQLVAGALYALAAAGCTVLITQGLLDLELLDVGKTYWVMTLVCYSFFLMQTAVVSWLGMPGIPLFILMFFFGAPVLGMPKEFLPTWTQDWLLSWLPLRFSVESLRDVLYFGHGLNLTEPATTLGLIGGAGAVLTLLSVLRKGKQDPQRVQEAQKAS